MYLLICGLKLYLEFLVYFKFVTPLHYFISSWWFILVLLALRQLPTHICQTRLISFQFLKNILSWARNERDSDKFGRFYFFSRICVGSASQVWD